MTSLIAALGFGLLIGAQHAFEPDHLAAIGTMLPEESSPRRASLRGAIWGLGHGLAIAAVGLPLILLGLQVPEHLEAAAEFVVGTMLVGLGLSAIWRARRAQHHMEEAKRNATRSTLPVGLIHGLAGSGAAVVLATTQAPSQWAAVVFLLVFVAGSTLGMTAVAGFVSLPIEKLTEDRARTPWLLMASGALSLVVGIVWSGPHVLTWLA